MEFGGRFWVGLLACVGACGGSGTEDSVATDGIDSAADGTDGGLDTEGGPNSSSDSDPNNPSASDGSTGEVSLCGADEIECDGICCEGADVCLEGSCASECGPEETPCGPDRTCCSSAEACYLGQCVVPGGPCETVACATQRATAECDEGFVCDGDFGLCMPSFADPSCEYAPPPAQFDPRPQFSWGRRGDVPCQDDGPCQAFETCSEGICQPTWPHIDPSERADYYNVSSTPVVADLDADCVPEIVFNSYLDNTAFQDFGVIRAIRGDTGAPVWSTTWSEIADGHSEVNIDATANPAVGDIDGDGLPEVIVHSAFNGPDDPNPHRNLIAIDDDGSLLWTSDDMVGNTMRSGSVSIANMDNAGPPELVMGSAVFDNEGNLLWEGGDTRYSLGPMTCIADLSGDGRPNIVDGATAYETRGTVAGGDFTGSVLWTSGLANSRCGIADFDADGRPEVIAVRQGSIHALDGQSGEVRASFAMPTMHESEIGGAPNIADFDGDGTPDIGTAGANFYVVVRFGGQQFSELWRAPTEDDSSRQTGSSVFDFDGDGRSEVIYNDEHFLRIYPGVEPGCPNGEGCDGIMTDDEILFRDPNTSRTRSEYPVVADVDGDFKAELVFPANNDISWGIDGGLEVWSDALDNWVGTRPVWNQHSYHVTNVEVDGTIPVSEPDAWTSGFNSYRRNAQGLSSFCAPDLKLFDVGTDTADCLAGTVRAEVANVGCLGAGAGVTVQFFIDDVLVGEAVTQAQLAPGARETVEIELAEPMVSFVVEAEVDGQGMFNECDESNRAESKVLCVPAG